jgi:hypothetical protein
MSNKRAKRLTITREFADQFAQKLEQLPARKKTTLNTKELISENAQQLTHLLANGYSYEDLLIILKEEGIHLTKPTLRQYLNEAKKGSDNPDEQSLEQQPVAEKASTQRTRRLDTNADRQAAAEAETTTQPAQAIPERRKFGQSRLQSDENSDRYPDGHGTPIEMKSDL